MKIMKPVFFILVLLIIMASSINIYGEAARMNENLSDKNIKELIQDLINNDFAISSKAIDKLSEVGNDSIPYLKEILESSEDRWAKRKVLTVLDRIGSKETIDLLFLALSDNDEMIREVATKTLERFADDILPAVKEQLVDPNYYTRVQAVKILKGIGWNSDDINEYLITELSGEDSKKTVILQQLANMGAEAKSVVPELNKILADSEETLVLRLKVLESLEAIDKEAVPLDFWILAFRSESVEKFRRLYEKANNMLVIAGQEAIAVLRDALSSEYPEVRTRTIMVIDKIDRAPAELYAELFEAMFDEKWYVRYQASSVLKKYDLNRVLADLLEIYKNDDNKKEVALANINYLGKEAEETLAKLDTSPANKVKQPEDFSKVSIEESNKSVQIANNKINMVIDRHNGSISKLLNAEGVDIMDNVGYSYVNGFFDSKKFWFGNDLGKAEYHLVRQEDDLVEIKFSTTPSEALPFAVSLHYLLRDNDQGFYWFLTVEHPEDMPAGSYGFLRRVTRVSSDLLTHAAQSDGRLVKIPVSTVDAPVEEVMDATFRQPDDGSVYTKYDFADYMAEHYFHGALGKNSGYWSIAASNEFKNGGPTKQYNTVHDGGDTQVILNILQSVHFIGDARINVNKEWGKIYGPFFVYLNSGENMAEMWVDAQKRAAEEREKWPYKWMENPLYPIERGSVSGKIEFEDGQKPAGGWVILGKSDMDWQNQSENYLFWTKIDKNGSFELKNVREGEYTLYSYTPGIFGEFRKDNITVKNNKNTDLGKLRWKELSYGKKLWEIGIPDRTAREFLNGNSYRQWDLTGRYPLDFPEDVSFKIGESDLSKDWNYAHVANNPLTGKAAPWDIIFELDGTYSGKAYLSIAIAGSHDVNLSVTVNGNRAGYIMLANDSSIHRGGKQGLYREELIEFDASLLEKGENKIRLTIDAKDWKAVMYDYLKLEIAD